MRSARAWLARLVPVLAALVAVALLGAVLQKFVVSAAVVSSSSMSPLLQPGDRIVVWHLAYRGPGSGDVQRGDIVLFDGRGTWVPAETSGDTEFVKRVLGVGGDRITCCDANGRLLVNGRALEERYLAPGDTASSVPFDIAVPRGELWLMGDHRSVSADSRDHLGGPGGGTVSLSSVVGKVVAVMWPANRGGLVGQ